MHDWLHKLKLEQVWSIVLKSLLKFQINTMSTATEGILSLTSSSESFLHSPECLSIIFFISNAFLPPEVLL